jgi:hypothetical protein
MRYLAPSVLTALREEGFQRHNEKFVFAPRLEINADSSHNTESADFRTSAPAVTLPGKCLRYMTVKVRPGKHWQAFLEMAQEFDFDWPDFPVERIAAAICEILSMFFVIAGLGLALFLIANAAIP